MKKLHWWAQVWKIVRRKSNIGKSDSKTVSYKANMTWVISSKHSKDSGRACRFITKRELMKSAHCKPSSMLFSLKYTHFRISISRRIVKCKTHCKCLLETIFPLRTQSFPSHIPQHSSPDTLFINEKNTNAYILNVYILSCFVCKT